MWLFIYFPLIGSHDKAFSGSHYVIINITIKKKGEHGMDAFPQFKVERGDEIKDIY